MTKNKCTDVNLMMNIFDYFSFLDTEKKVMTQKEYEDLMQFTTALRKKYNISVKAPETEKRWN